MIDLGNPHAFDLEVLKTRIRDDMNMRLGDGTVAEVLVERLDFMSKEDIRTNVAREGRHPVEEVKIVAGVKIDEPATTGTRCSRESVRQWAQRARRAQLLFQH